MIRSIKIFFVWTFLVFIHAIPAWSAADPPKGYQPVQTTGVFSVFSAKTTLADRIVIEPGLEIVKEPDVQRFSFRAVYGITGNTEAGISLSGGSREGEDGMEDVSFGIRHRFIDEGQYGPAAAALLAVSLPAGDETKGFGSGNLETEALIIASKRIGPFTGYFNMGYNIIYGSDKNNEFILAGGLDFSAAKRLVLLAELYGKTSRDSDKINLIEARVGYRTILAKSISNTVGLGFGLNSREPDYRLMILFTLGYPQQNGQSLIRVQDDLKN